MGISPGEVTNLLIPLKNRNRDVQSRLVPLVYAKLGCQSRTVELRFFGGLSEKETAEVLGIPSRTVKREWAVARASLYKEFSKGAVG